MMLGKGTNLQTAGHNGPTGDSKVVRRREELPLVGNEVQVPESPNSILIADRDFPPSIDRFEQVDRIGITRNFQELAGDLIT
jgi:hypothetical protein